MTLLSFETNRIAVTLTEVKKVVQALLDIDYCSLNIRIPKSRIDIIFPEHIRLNTSDVSSFIVIW